MRQAQLAASFIDHLREVFAPLAQFDARRMFGGWGLYLDGRMCGLVADGQLYLKTDASTRPHFEAAGCGPFIYTGQQKPITMSYWSVPEDALESSEAMAPWARRALQAAKPAPPSLPRRASRGRARSAVAPKES